MESRTSRICDALLEAGWLAVLVVTPLFFNTSDNRVFEPDKLHLVRSIALVMAVAWLVQLLDRAWGRRATAGPNLWTQVRRTPLVLPTLILVAAYLLSTALSVTPGISFLGSYVRGQGTYTFLCYVIIFFVVLTHLRSQRQVNRLLHAIILTSLPISIYGLIQHYHLDPLPWGGDVVTRVAANMGNSIFVAAYLIMAFFLTLERLIHSTASLLSAGQGSIIDALRVGGYLFILAVQALTIVFTQSRGPWLGLAAGLYVFAMLGFRLLVRWASTSQQAPPFVRRAGRPVLRGAVGIYLSLIGLTIAGIVLLIVLNQPQGPLASWRSKPYIGRMATVLSTSEGTNAVRVLIWQGAVDMMLKPHAPIQFPDGRPDPLNAIRLLVGYGPESMWVAYNPFYPPRLAQYEARNASPDRSHNETFDALIRTGLLGLAAQLALYGSILFFALRWLGLVRGPARRNFFLASLATGAAAGVILPLIFDGSLRLAGVGLPVGFILGLVFYVAVELVVSSLVAGAGEGDVAAAGEGAAAPARAGGQQQVLLLAVFSAIVAHFIEIHTGIAIASTLVHFWVLAAVLVVVGMGWLDRPAEPAATAARQPVEAGSVAGRAGAGSRGLSGDRPVPGRRGNAERPLAAAQRRPERGTDLPRGRSSSGQISAARPAGATQAGELPALHGFWPYLGISLVVTLVTTWNYLVNQTNATDVLTTFLNAFVMKVNSATHNAEFSPVLLILLAFTWAVGGLLALGESPRDPVPGRWVKWARNLAAYFAAVTGVFAVYGLIQAQRVTVGAFSGLEYYRHIAGNVGVFDAALLLVGLALAGGIWLADSRPRPGRWFAGDGALPIGAAVVLGLLALLVIVQVNIRSLQADTYYKAGLGFEEAGSLEGAVVLYREAALLEPNEDYYYLFLGRALLEYAGGAKAGTAVLPTDLTGMAPAQALTMAQQALQLANREDLTRASYAVLLGAQRLNPLNTDHTANLARLFRSWAFANASSSGGSASNAVLRQLVQTQGSQVDKAKLQQSVSYYQQATMLSPHNAILWNEQATVRHIAGDTAGALAALGQSIAVDPQFYQTYLLRGDLLAESGDRQGALDAYQKAGSLRPGDAAILGAVGVYAAQAGDVPAALTAFDQVIHLELGLIATDQKSLADLDYSAAQAGGYERLSGTAASRRDALQRSISDEKGQLHLAYRNKALVLRDAGRLDEALAVAQQALAQAPADQKAITDQLIADIQKRMGG